MTDNRWATIDRLLGAALERPPHERAAFLREACGDDDTLRREVESLVAHDARAAGFMSLPAAAPAGDGGGAASDMSGRRIGPYVVLASLGAGGMGEVYRARDTTLGREVAIKILPHVLSADPDRRARFEREARLLATLNHPHIGAIYGVEHIDGARALVLELVEGDTLNERIAQGPLPLGEALRIARQIGDALEAAHDKGIVHRDLKPANIKVTPDGIVKVLDFGLAKATGGENAGADLTTAPTVTGGGTEQGTILGTGSYMSPEQARGLAVDKRTDIWAFGCVLYEMLTGRLAFGGATLSDTIVSLLEREPEWSALPPNTPAAIRRLLLRCCTKDPRRRLRDIGDALTEIEETLSGGLSSAETGVVARVAPAIDNDHPAPATSWRGRLGAIVGALLVAIVTGSSLAYLWREAPEVPSWPFKLDLPANVVLSVGEDPLRSFVISPDGEHVVLTGVYQDTGTAALFIQKTRTSGPNIGEPVRGSEGGTDPFWFPDSRSVGFYTRDKVQRVHLSGGPPSEIATGMGGTGGATSNGEGVMLASLKTPGPIYMVSEPGAMPRAVTSLNAASEVDHHSPQFAADRRRFFFIAAGHTPADNRVYVASVDASQRREIGSLKGVSSIAVALPDHLIFLRGATIYSQRLTASLELTGEPATLVNDALSPISVSANGMLAYRTVSTAPAPLLWIDYETGVEAGQAMPPGYYTDPALSPDGAKLAFASRESPSATFDVHTKAISSTETRPLTRDSADDRAPVFSPNSDEIVFASYRSGRPALYLTSWAAGAGSERAIASRQTGAIWPYQWGTHGLLYFAGTVGAFELFSVSLADRKSAPLLSQDGFSATDPSVSKQGWLAYTSNAGGRLAIYVSPYPASTGTSYLAAENGGDPTWSSDGRELFYLNTATGELWSVEVRLAIPPDFGVRRRRYSGSLDYANGQSFALDPARGRILVNPLETRRGDIRIHTNWRSLLASVRPDW